MSEREHQSLESLVARQERLSTIIAQRTSNINHWREQSQLPTASPLDRLRRIRLTGTTIPAVENSITKRLQPELNRINMKIDELVIEPAKAYQVEQATARNAFEKIQRGITRRALPPEAIDEARGILQEIENRPLKDSLLARGLALLENQRKQQEAEQAKRLKPSEPAKPVGKEALPQVLFDERKQTLQINSGPVVKLGKIESVLIGFLYNHPNQEFSARELKQVAEKAGSKAKTVNIVSATLYRVEKRLGSHEIFKRIAHSQAAKWSLPRTIPQSKETKKPVKINKIEGLERPVFPTRLKALNAFIDNPDITIEEIISILGPSVNTGRILTPSQARFALIQAVSKLAYRQKHTKKNLNEEEINVWAKIKNQPCIAEDLKVGKAFNEIIRSWFQRQKSRIPAESTGAELITREEPEIFSKKELAFLAALIYFRRNTTIKVGTESSFRFKIENEVCSACQDLVNQVPIADLENLGSQGEDYLQSRFAVLEKLDKILKSEKIEDIIKDHTNDAAEILLTWLYCLDQEQMSGLMAQFSDQNLEYVGLAERTGIRNIWRNLQDTNLENASPLQRPTQPEATARVNKAERADPDIRQKIDNYLSQIENYQIKEPINSAQLTRLFSKIKTVVTQRMIEKGYVKPATRDGIPQYLPIDIVTMLYIYDQQRTGRNFNSKLVGDLRKVIQEQLDKQALKESAPKSNP